MGGEARRAPRGRSSGHKLEQPGRCASVEANSRPSKGRNPAGTSFQSGAHGAGAPVYGVRPAAVKKSVDPIAYTSTDAFTCLLSSYCSHGMKAGVPSAHPVLVSALLKSCRSARTARPKSRTTGPFGPSTTFPGFRSRCRRPAPWTDSSASTRPSPRAAHAPTSVMGPPSFTCVSRDGPAMYSIASHGSAASGAAPRNAGILGPTTVRIASTSATNRARFRSTLLASSSVSSSVRIVFSTASEFSPGEPASASAIRYAVSQDPSQPSSGSRRARYARPMPPCPRRANVSKGPRTRGSRS